VDLRWLRPSRTIVITRWRTKPATFLVLLVGLWIFGTGEALLVNAHLGVSPWTVLAQGLSRRTSISIGSATLVISLVVLLAWIPLRERLGMGTVANTIVIAFALQVMIGVVPVPTNFGYQVLEVLIGIASIGLASGLYLTTNLGPGPRDGMMTGLHQRTGASVGRIRLVLEVAVLTIGWALGGTVGLGTLLSATLIGAAVGYGLRLCGWLGRTANPAEPAVEPVWRPELEA
jgi:uncharacterized membrane protein YczE